MPILPRASRRCSTVLASFTLLLTAPMAVIGCDGAAPADPQPTNVSDDAVSAQSAPSRATASTSGRFSP